MTLPEAAQVFDSLDYDPRTPEQVGLGHQAAEQAHPEE